MGLSLHEACDGPMENLSNHLIENTYKGSRPGFLQGLPRARLRLRQLCGKELQVPAQGILGLEPGLPKHGKSSDRGHRYDSSEMLRKRFRHAGVSSIKGVYSMRPTITT